MPVWMELSGNLGSSSGIWGLDSAQRLRFTSTSCSRGTPHITEIQASQHIPWKKMGSAGCREVRELGKLWEG